MSVAAQIPNNVSAPATSQYESAVVSARPDRQAISATKAANAKSTELIAARAMSFCKISAASIHAAKASTTVAAKAAAGPKAPALPRCALCLALSVIAICLSRARMLAGGHDQPPLREARDLHPGSAHCFVVSLLHSLVIAKLCVNIDRQRVRRRPTSSMEAGAWAHAKAACILSSHARHFREGELCYPPAMFLSSWFAI